MQWWGALTQQFTQLAANAMQDGATDSARNLAGNLVQQGLDAAGETFRQAAATTATPQRAAGTKGAAKDADKATARSGPKAGAKASRKATSKTTTKTAAAKRRATSPR